MISHEHPRFSDIELSPWRAGFGITSDVEPCAGCGNDTHLEDRLSRDYETIFCQVCRDCCAICGDWMQGKPEMRDAEGRRIHISCEVDAVLEMMQ